MPVLESFMQAQTPTVSVDGAGLKGLAGGADANDFGGQIGKALEGAGDAISAFAEHQRQDQKTLDGFKRQAGWQDFLSAEQTRMAEAERSGLADGGAGFTKNYMTGQATKEPGMSQPAPVAASSDGGFDGRAQKWLDANTANATPQERAQWTEQIAAARRTMGAQALQKEFQERDRFYNSQIADKLDGLMKSVDQTPGGLEIQIKAGNAIIDASGLSAANKDAQKAAWESNAKLVYGYAQARNDPAGTAAQLGSATAGYYAKVRGKESQNNPSIVNSTPYPGHPNGTQATGLYQFIPSTWKGIVNSPEGKAAGLTIAGITDAGQQEKGVRIFTAQNAQILQKGGFDATEANLRMAHFMGAQGAVDFLGAMKANPSAAGAALFKDEAHANHSLFFDKAGTPLTLGQIYGNMTAGFTGAKVPTTMDPHLDDLSYTDKAKVLGAAERNFHQANAEASAAQQQQQQKWFNDFQVQLHDGKAGAADIVVARAQGQLTNISDIERAENIVAQRQQGVQALADWGTLSKGGPGAFNPLDPRHKDAADAAFHAAGGDVPAALSTWQQSNILPDGGAVALRGALLSQDPDKVKASAQALGNMLAINPNAFAGAKGQSDLEDAGAQFNHQVNDLGKTAEEAAQSISQRNNPAYKASVKVGEPETKAFRDDLLKGDPASDVLKSFGGWFGRGTPAAEPGQRDAIARDYAQFASDHFANSGDKDAAKTFALAQVRKLYGVSNGYLTKWPPEHVYPAGPGGDYSYLYKQAADSIKTATGEEVDPSKVWFVPLPTATAEAWRNGKTVPYAIQYTGMIDGIPITKIAPSIDGKTGPRPWVADTSAVGVAHAVESAKSARDFAAARRFSDPAEHPNAGPAVDGGHGEGPDLQPNNLGTLPDPAAQIETDISSDWLQTHLPTNTPNIRK